MNPAPSSAASTSKPGLAIVLTGRADRPKRRSREPLPGRADRSYGQDVGHADDVLAIDQGTTSTRAIVFDADATAVAVAQRDFQQHYPAPGWVEHDPEDIWRDTLTVTREVLGKIDPQ